MQLRSIAAVAAVAFAANVAAEPMPYQPDMMRMSARDLFGRQTSNQGYQPQQTVCSTGDTCEQACGAGYTACSSSANQVHCFNPKAGETCCPDMSGISCDAGYYCTSDNKGETWCCPNGMDLKACAAAYSVAGGLVSQTPRPTSTSTTSSSSTTSTSHTTSSSTAALNTAALNTTSLAAQSVSPSPSLVPSASFVPSNTTSITAVAAPSLAPTGPPTGAGSAVSPATALVLLAAGLAALL